MLTFIEVIEIFINSINKTIHAVTKNNKIALIKGKKKNLCKFSQISLSANAILLRKVLELFAEVRIS